MAEKIPLIHEIIKDNPFALQSSSKAIKKLLIKHPEIPLVDVLPRYIVPVITEKGVEIVDFFDESPSDGTEFDGIKHTFSYFFNDPDFTYEDCIKRYQEAMNTTGLPKPDFTPDLESAEEVTIY